MSAAISLIRRAVASRTGADSAYGQSRRFSAETDLESQRAVTSTPRGPNLAPRPSRRVFADTDLESQDMDILGLDEEIRLSPAGPLPSRFPTSAYSEPTTPQPTLFTGSAFEYLDQVLSAFNSTERRQGSRALALFQSELVGAAQETGLEITKAAPTDYDWASNRLREWQRDLSTWIDSLNESEKGFGWYWTAMMIGGSMPRLIRVQGNSGKAIVNDTTPGGREKEWNAKVLKNVRLPEA